MPQLYRGRGYLPQRCASTRPEQMPTMPSLTVALPRLPLFGWASFTGPKRSRTPCIVDRSDIVFTRSGQAAIGLALRDLAVGPGDRVLVPTYHCPTMIAPVAALGAQPQFFPLDASGAPRVDVIANMDLSGVRAMIAAHYFGLPQPMAHIRRFCDARGIALIEDCAHAIFGATDGRPVGSWGHYAIASLPKFFPTTDGGCLVAEAFRSPITNLPRRAPADELRVIANSIEIGARHRALHGVNRLVAGGFALVERIRGKSSRGDAHADPEGSPQRSPPSPSPTSSTLWCRASAWSRFIAGAAHRERIFSNRRRNYRHLCALLADVPGTHIPWPKLPDLATPYVFPLWVDEPAKSYQRARRAGVPLFRWDDAWPGTPLIDGDCGPQWGHHIFQLGCHQDLGVDDLGVMTDTLRRIFSSETLEG